MGHNGALRLLDPKGIRGVTGPGSHPPDAGFIESGRYFYVRSAGTLGITGFYVQGDGSLTRIGGVIDLPPTALGLLAR